MSITKNETLILQISLTELKLVISVCATSKSGKYHLVIASATSLTHTKTTSLS